MADIARWNGTAGYPILKLNEAKEVAATSNSAAFKVELTGGDYKTLILINNAGVQGTANDIEINLKGLINCTKKYALNNKHIKSVINQAAASGSTGADFGSYVASKAGVIGYTKFTAKEIAKYGATCNSISFGGVLSPVNWEVMNDEKKWNKIMGMTPLKKWVTPAEAAEWIYFLAVTNKSCTAQDIIIDNGEMFNHTFVWN